MDAAGAAADVGRRAPHVEPQRAPDPRRRGRHLHPHGPPGRARKHRVPPPERLRPDQSAAGGHEVQRGPRHRRRDPVDIGFQHRRQVGVRHRRLRPRHEPGQGGYLAAQGHEGEPRRPRQSPRALFVDGVQVAVQEGDGHALEALFPGLLKDLLQHAFVQCADHRPVRPQPFVRLRHARIERRWLDDGQGEELRPGLVPDLQGVAKPLCRNEKRLGAPALQQGVGGHGRAHLDRFDAPGWKGLVRPHPQQTPHPLDRRVLIPGRLRQHFQRPPPAVRPDPDHIGEGAAPVDPEPPAARTGVSVCHRAAHTLE